jgi:hypothetical protein
MGFFEDLTKTIQEVFDEASGNQQAGKPKPRPKREAAPRVDRAALEQQQAAEAARRKALAERQAALEARRAAEARRQAKEAARQQRTDAKVLRHLLRDKHSIRQAIVLNELLSPPVGMRDQH